MNTLNLVNPSKSDIAYEIIQFSDSETHIKLGDINRKEGVVVITRIANWNDLMILMQVGDILKRQEVEVFLYISYLLSMRMDRVMNFGEAYTLKIVCDMINTLNASYIRIVEPHSDKTCKLLKANAVQVLGAFDLADALIVFPDAGAGLRYNGFNNTLIANKKRNPDTGKIESMEFVNIPQDTLNKLKGEDETIKKVVVLDDLCDAGGTFLGVRSLLKEAGCTLPVNICVTHMVNPVGIENLSKAYDNVYFTDSYRSWQDEKLPDNVHVISLFDEK